MAQTTRLAAISDLVPAGGVILDIGSDHAFLGIMLIRQNKARLVVNVEKAKGPLQAGIANVNKTGLQGQFAHILSNGFTDYDGPKEVDTIVLAGFGGTNMVSVLDQNKTTWKYVVAQPSNNAKALRHFASANGLTIDEEAVINDDKYYELVRIANRTGRSLSEKEELFGPINLVNRSEHFVAYWTAQLNHLQSRNATANVQRLSKQIEMIKAMLENTN